MIYASDCFQKYGDPALQKNLTLFVIPSEFRAVNSVLPKKIFCNIDLVEPLKQAFKNLIDKNLLGEIKTWDGCFNIRSQRNDITKLSLHSWAVAIDINAASNRMGSVPKITHEFAQCFIDAGFDWGGNFHHPDGMHFQLSKI